MINLDFLLDAPTNADKHYNSKLDVLNTFKNHFESPKEASYHLIDLENQLKRPLGISNLNIDEGVLSSPLDNTRNIWKLEPNLISNIENHKSGQNVSDSPKQLQTIVANTLLTAAINEPSIEDFYKSQMTSFDLLANKKFGNYSTTNYLNNKNTNVNDNGYNKSAIEMSRVYIASCKKISEFLSIVHLYIDPMTITPARELTFENEKTVVLGWFDFRNVSLDINRLTSKCSEHGLSDIKFTPIFEANCYKKVTETYNFRFFDDVYDSIYIQVEIPNALFNCFQSSQIQNSLHFQLSKFGAIYSIESLNSFNTFFRCRFYDIRVPFQMKKLTFIKIGNLKANIFNTLIELCTPSLQRNCSESQNISPATNFDFNDYETQFGTKEWRKYIQLKHRRLATQPFITSDIPAENKIDITKITNGEDSRVTLMVRNIPNKVTHKELKDYIDTTSWGEYDFLFQTDLRIDFENHCNVGYAFISFANPLSIVEFYKARHGKKWCKFKSEKVCQLAYAKVQGISALIRKFKGSKILECNVSYRPKIYYTDGISKGQEMVFPF